MMMSSTLSIVTIAIGLLPIVLGEPPVHYGVPAFSGPSSFGGGSGHGGGGGGYHEVGVGHQSNEGLFVDPHLLHKIKGILIENEAQEEQFRGHNHHHHHGLSAGYLSPVYGAPHHDHHYERVVGVEFGGVRPAIQVAQFHQISHEHNHHYEHHGGGGGGYAPSHGYIPPPTSYIPPSAGYIPPPTFISPPSPSLAYGPPGINPRHHH